MEELQKAVAYRDFYKLLSEHTTRTLYNESRADVLELISRKISRKEYLIKQQDEAFTSQLHKQITGVESEISTLLAFVQAFDAMAELLQQEAATAVDEWWKADRKVLLLNQVIDAQTEMRQSWSDTAFSLHNHILIQKAYAERT